MCQNRYIHCQLNVKLYKQETRSKMLLIMMTLMMTDDNDDDDDYDDEDDNDDRYFNDDLLKSTIHISFDFKTVL